MSPATPTPATAPSPRVLRVFAYGSLMNPASAERALQRPLAPHEIQAMELPGYVRVWDSRHRVFCEALGRETDAAFLNLAAAPGESAIGMVYTVSPAELERLAAREKGYGRVDVGPALGFPPDEPVWTFIDPRGLGEGSAGDGDCVFLDAYEAKVLTACAPLGEAFVARYRASTRPPAAHLPRVPGAYRFADPVQRSLT